MSNNDVARIGVVGAIRSSIGIDMNNSTLYRVEVPVARSRNTGVYSTGNYETTLKENYWNVVDEAIPDRSTAESHRIECSPSVEEETSLLPPNSVEGNLNDAGPTPSQAEPPPGINLRSQFHKIMISGTAKKLRTFLENSAVNHKNVWITEELDTPLHSAATSSNTRWAKEATQIIMDRINKGRCPLKREELLNFQNNQKNTALHLAVENQSGQLAQCLVDHGASYLVRNLQDVTPLERMYEKTPEVVLHLLNAAIQPGAKFANDGNLEFEINFRALVGGFSDSLQAANGEEITQRTHDDEEAGSPMKSKETSSGSNLEMDVLAKMVYQNYKSSASVILPHPIVKTFLELKLKKLQWRIYGLTFIYILMYLLFNWLAIMTFIVKFPYTIPENNVTSSEESTSVYANITIWSYLFGISLKSATGFNVRESHGEKVGASYVSNELVYMWAVFLHIWSLVLGITTWCLEFWELRLILRLTSVSGKFQAVCSYFRSLENILQHILALGTVVVSFACLWSVFSKHRFSSWTYWLTAWLVLVSWTLILLQLGNFPGVGKYVEIFKTVIKKITGVVLIYICFLFGFSIAFSIIFPQDRFVTFPMSFFRSMSMMAGELNFDEIFDPEKRRPFPLSSQAVYLGFTVTVTIALVNLLTGLAVDDIGKKLKDSDVIHRSIQVQRLYILERMLFPFSEINIFSDICVLPLEKRNGSNEFKAKRLTKLSELPPELHQELRLAYAEAGGNLNSDFSDSSRDSEMKQLKRQIELLRIEIRKQK